MIHTYIQPSLFCGLTVCRRRVWGWDFEGCQAQPRMGCNKSVDVSEPPPWVKLFLTRP
jgi:hypothetical protein